MSDMEEKLIEAVRGRTILYDTSHPDYLKIKLKLQIWEEIAEDIGIKSGTEAKKLWEKLRHSLRDAQRRQQKFVRSGAAASSFKPWRFQTEMGFLQPYMANIKRDTNLNEGSDEESMQNLYEEKKEEESLGEHVNEECINFENSSKSQTREPPLYPSGSSRGNTPPPRKKKCKVDVSKLIKQSIQNREKRAAERAIERTQLLNRFQTPSDPLYHFFMSIYETVKRMPPMSQHVVKNQIYKTVNDMEATLLNMPEANIFHPSDFHTQYDSHFTSQPSTSTPHSHSPHHIEETSQSISDSEKKRDALINYLRFFPEE